jgi:hypothetical protein
MYTTEQLADRWFDKREIQNLAGKYVTSILIKREGEIFDTFWAKGSDVCLSFNDGSYVGEDAVRGYYSAVAANTAAKSAFIKGLFPEKLGSLTDEQLFGVGQLKAMPITTPVIEIAADGKTAKGIWHVQGSDNDVTVYGPLSYWTLGFICIDFIKQGDDWKLWHVLHAEDIRNPMGENWVYPTERKAAPGFESIAEIKLPEYSVKRANFVGYSKDRPFTAPPRLPEPYDSFDKTFSYGV